MATGFEKSTEPSLLQQMITSGHFVPSGEPGVYGRSAIFEEVRTGIDGLVTRFGAADRADTPRFPPVIPRTLIEKVGYLQSFPHLCGSIFSFSGTDSEATDLADRASRHEDWSMHLSATNLVLVPAACYPAYPAIAARGPLPSGGVTLDLGGCYVFRNEPSADPARLQIFHQRELVRIGAPQDVLEWRETWMKRAQEIFGLLGLNATLDVASDAFFGRGGKLLAVSQRQQRLKFEALVPIASANPTAVASFNFHQDHFGSAFGILFADGSTAVSACTGFGLERITIALFRAHGVDVREWPKEVRSQLWPNHPPQGE
jgi:seryl-tRNA synthetase